MENDQTGLRRRLLCPSTKVSFGKKLYGILQSPFWAGQCFLDNHQIYAPVVSKLSELGYSPDNLSGRLFHSGRLRTDYQTPLSNCAESPGELGFCNQPEEISVIPCTENRVYGCVGRFANPVTCPVPGQTQEYSQGMQMSNSVTIVQQLAYLPGRLSSSIFRPFRSGGHYESQVFLIQEAIEELQWWEENLVAWKGRALA